MKSVKARTSGRIPAKETSVFCAQAALLLQAGIPLSEGLSTLPEEGTPSGQELLRQMAATVKETGSLYEGVAAAGVFPSYMVQMIHIGETVGKLEDVLRALSRFYEREDNLRRAVRSAVLYPMILIVLMAAVVAILVAAVLPVFSQVLDGLGVAASGSGILALGNTIGLIALILVAVLLAAMVVLLAVCLTAGGREKLVRLSARLPFLRGVYRQISSGRFASVMSMMLSSGYNLEEALELAEGVVADPLVKEKIIQCREQVTTGVSFADALIRLDLFSGLYARLIQTGEKAGRLDDVMQNMAARYEEEIDESLSSLVSVIEPTLVILLSVIIGGILLSVMLPLIRIMSLIG